MVVDLGQAMPTTVWGPTNSQRVDWCFEHISFAFAIRGGPFVVVVMRENLQAVA